MCVVSYRRTPDVPRAATEADPGRNHPCASGPLPVTEHIRPCPSVVVGPDRYDEENGSGTPDVVWDRDPLEW